MGNSTFTKFSQILCEERTKQGLSKYALSKMAGVTATAIYHYENEKRKPTIECADKLLSALGVSMVIGKGNQ